MKYLGVVIGLLGFANSAFGNKVCFDPQRMEVSLSRQRTLYGVYHDDSPVATVTVGGWALFNDLFQQAKKSDAFLCVNTDKAPNGHFDNAHEVKAAVTIEPITDRQAVDAARQKLRDKRATQEQKLEAQRKAEQDRREAISRAENEKFEALNRIELTIGNEQLILWQKAGFIFNNSITYQFSIPFGNSDEKMTGVLSRSEYTYLVTLKTEAINKVKPLVVKTVLLEQWLQTPKRPLEQLGKLIYLAPDEED